MSVYCLGILAEKEYGVAVEAEGIPALFPTMWRKTIKDVNKALKEI